MQRWKRCGENKKKEIDLREKHILPVKSVESMRVYLNTCYGDARFLTSLCVFLTAQMAELRRIFLGTDSSENDTFHEVSEADSSDNNTFYEVPETDSSDNDTFLEVFETHPSE